MKFRLQTVLWVFALLATAMATFVVWGILATLFVASFWAVAFRKLRINLFEWLITVVVILITVALLLPAISSAPRASSRHSCVNNVQQIASAIRNYEQSHGSLPPAYTTDENGKPLHSWRVLLLPYFEEQNLYDAINLDEPWNSPNNHQLWEMMPEIYRCTGCEVGRNLGLLPSVNHSTSYFAVVGPQTVWTGDKGTKLHDISDGKRQTLLVLEAYKPETCWMEPSDLTTKEVLERMRTHKLLGHLHTQKTFFSTSVISPKESRFAYVEYEGGGSGVKISYGMFNKSKAMRLLTRNGNEKEETVPMHGWVLSSDIRLAVAYHWKRIYSFTLFLLLSILPVAQLRRRHVLAKLVG